MADVMTVAEIQLDVDSLTLGEMAAAEEASGKSITVLLNGAAHQKLLAVFVYRLRSSGVAPSWQELQNLRLRES